MQRRSLGNGGLEDNLAAAGLLLPPADLANVETAAAAVPIQGARRPGHLEPMTGR